jgi:two-component system cell cycle sensor histidine kinase/response regulator CckA
MAIIMLVDDDRDVLETIERVLKSAGHEVVAMGSAIEALDVLDRGGRLDLLLTDVIMPGLNGFNLARMARFRRPAIKILYLTGYSQKAEVMLDKGEKYGKMLIKPILPDDLRSEVQTTLSL